MIYQLKKIKSDIRAEQMKKRKLLPHDVKNNYDEKIAEALFSSVSYRFADIILLYASKSFEVDTWKIAQRALKDGKRIAYPVCEPEKNLMTFHFVEKREDLIEGSFRILEPKTDLEKYDPIKQRSSLAICLVPAIVYDIKGYRIGYGKGYYDRYLSNFPGTKIGLIYSDFIFHEPLPHGKFDLAADVLISENGVHTVNAN